MRDLISTAIAFGWSMLAAPPTTGETPVQTRLELCFAAHRAHCFSEHDKRDVSEPPKTPPPSARYMHQLKVKELFKHIPDRTESSWRRPLFTTWDAPGAPEPHEPLFRSWAQQSWCNLPGEKEPNSQPNIGALVTSQIVRERVSRASNANALRRSVPDTIPVRIPSTLGLLEEDAELNPDVKLGQLHQYTRNPPSPRRVQPPEEIEREMEQATASRQEPYDSDYAPVPQPTGTADPDSTDGARGNGQLDVPDLASLDSLRTPAAAPAEDTMPAEADSNSHETEGLPQQTLVDAERRRLAASADRPTND
ncbi:hypothetical protein AB1Y20_021323 [Prymnesium parvum]|uniref:Holocytochrome c-type synthase n=1 Tax=Prymnesium parvum TaxID=97485 RepID=A0AB34JKY1_PRYPA